MELYQPQLLRLYAYSCTDHGMVEMDADGFGVDNKLALFVDVGKAAVGRADVNLYHLCNRARADIFYSESEEYASV